jgi:excisionase family DNA binding protein
MIILQGIPLQEFYSQIESIIEKKLEEKLTKIVRQEKVYEKPYLTRKEVCKILQISLPTLSDWAKQGFIKSHRIGSRILFKAEEIDASLISRFKFKR